MTIIPPKQFLEGARQLLLAAHPDQTTVTWHHICATDRCPPLLIRMMLQQQLHLHLPTLSSRQCTTAAEDEQNYSDDDDRLTFAASTTTRSCRQLRTWFQKRDAQGRLPLHWAAMAQAVSTTTRCSGTATVVELILAAHPAAAAVMDATGRFPLHYAVANRTLVQVVVPQQRQGRGGKRSAHTNNVRHPLKAIGALARTYPTALTVPDPVTFLYPVLQLAASMEEDKSKSTNTGSKLSKIPRDDVKKEEEEDDEYDDFVDYVAMDVLYRLLLAHPDVCCYHRPRRAWVKQ